MKKMFISLMTASLLMGSYPAHAFDATKFWDNHKEKIGWMAAGAAILAASFVYLSRSSKPSFIRAFDAHEFPLRIEGAPHPRVIFQGPFKNIRIVGENDRTAIRTQSTFHGYKEEDIDRMCTSYEPNRLNMLQIDPTKALSITQEFYTDDTMQARDYTRKQKSYCDHTLHVPTNATVDLVTADISGTITVHNLRKQQIIQKSDKDRGYQIDYINEPVGEA